MRHQRRFRAFVVLGGSCLLLCSPAVVRAQDEDPDKVEDVAAELSRTQEKIAGIQEAKGNLAAAKKIYGELLAANPGDVKYKVHVCRLAGELKQYREVVKLASELIKLKPRELRFRLWLARALTLQKKTGEAAVHWEWIAANSPKDPESHQELASTYEELRDPAKALVHYDWLIGRFPKSLDYRLARFYLLGDLRRSKEQLVALRTLQRLAPRDPRVLLETGDYLLGEEKYDQAEAQFNSVLRLAPARKPTARKPGAKVKAPPSIRSRALAGLVQVKKARAKARREALEAYREAERHNDWQNDIWERGEDF